MTFETPEQKLAILHRARVLVVDDSRLMLQLLHECLRAFNVRDVVCVDNAAECIENMNNTAFDAVIIDWRLRESDGLDLVRKIRRSLPDPIRRIPIVLCTGYTEYERVLEARSSGIHEMLCKPVTPKELYLKLTSALFSDRAFIVTDHYVGPEQRQAMQKKPHYQRQRETGDPASGAAACEDQEIYL